ncbi:MAG: spermidine/putrescine ABC transporter substrate-binding protein [Chloroflexi bacterium]|nr:spermidine/putrescine ABC transporter substrate-binding protein [Chloroflexota bacterium]
MRQLLRARMDRRRFLAASGATMGALAMGGPRLARAQSSGGDLGDTLNIATWPLYHDQATLDAFTDATGVAVNIRVYGSTEEQEALIRAGNSGIDLAVPSQYAVAGWIADGLLERIDYGRLPSVDMAAWDPLFVDQDFDPGNGYTIPKNWGTTGITYWADEVDPPPTSWADFFRMAGEDAYSGRFQIVDHQISSLGSAAVAMGYGLNTVDETELNAIADMLIALKPHLFAINSDVEPPLRNRDTLATMAWTGNGVAVVRDNPDTAQYIVASDGGELWVDSWAIAADAPHKDAAYAFLDYILQPGPSAADTVFSLFPHANPAVLPLLPPEVSGNQVIYPPAELLQTLTISNAEAYNSPLRSDTWARIKSS